MRTFGETRSFKDRPWAELAEHWSTSARSDARFEHIAAIVDSVIASGAEDRLAGASSLYDLIVTVRPIPEPPYTVVVVRSPASVKPAPTGTVVIEHCSLTGRIDRIQRPTAEAVPLFWRFVIEKFGVEPQRS